MPVEAESAQQVGRNGRCATCRSSRPVLIAGLSGHNGEAHLRTSVMMENMEKIPERIVEEIMVEWAMALEHLDIAEMPDAVEDESKVKQRNERLTDLPPRIVAKIEQEEALAAECGPEFDRFWTSIRIATSHVIGPKELEKFSAEDLEEIAQMVDDYHRQNERWRIEGFPDIDRHWDDEDG